MNGNTIFYFTGTGGSLAAAKKLCTALPEFKLAPIAALERETEVSVSADAVGFVFPLYYAGLPNIVERFLKKLKFDKPCYVFAVVTCGVPWSGWALHRLNGLLRKKGQRLFAGFILKLVDNYLPHFAMPDESKQQELGAEAEKKLGSIAMSVGKREKSMEHESALWLYPSHWLYAPRFKRLDRFYRVEKSCNSCGTCQKVCPVDNIELKDGKPVWLHRCEFCMACIQYCPKQAIEWKSITENRGRYHYRGVSAAEVAKQKHIET